MRLKRLRENRGLTQAALAKKAGIARVYLAQVEGNVRTPSLHTLERLARALKVKPGELLG